MGKISQYSFLKQSLQQLPSSINYSTSLAKHPLAVFGFNENNFSATPPLKPQLKLRNPLEIKFQSLNWLGGKRGFIF